MTHDRLVCSLVKGCRHAAPSARPTSSLSSVRDPASPVVLRRSSVRDTRASERQRRGSPAHIRVRRRGAVASSVSGTGSPIGAGPPVGRAYPFFHATTHPHALPEIPRRRHGAPMARRAQAAFAANSWLGDTQPGALFHPMPDDPVKVATIECVVCGAYIEVYQGARSGEAGVCWEIRDAELCRQPPLHRCPQARLEVRRRFSDETGPPKR
jgi:hypothetical protein